MTQVTPPRSISKVRPMGEFSRAQNNYFNILEQMINQIYQRSGGAEDDTSTLYEDVESNNIYSDTINAKANELRREIEDIKNDEPINVLPKILSLEKRLDDIEAQSETNHIWKKILSRLDDIEAQL